MAEYYPQAAQEEAQGAGGEQRVLGAQQQAQVGVVVLGGSPNIIAVTGAQFREHLVAEAQLAAEKADKDLLGQFLHNDRILREHINVVVQIDDARAGEDSGEEEDSSGRSFDPDGSNSDDSGVGVHSDEE